MPIHNSTELPNRGPASDRRWVTAAITSSVARSVTKNPPLNSHGSAPSGVTMCSHQHNAPNPTNPTTAATSSSRPLERSGLRAMATGRHTMANAEPSNSPVSRVGVDRYSASIFEMHRPPTSQ